MEPLPIVDAAKMIGAGIAVLALWGVGIGIGNIFSNLITSIARNPAARDQVFGIGILGFWSVGFALQMGGVGPLTTLGGVPYHEYQIGDVQTVLSQVRIGGPTGWRAACAGRAGQGGR